MVEDVLVTLQEKCRLRACQRQRLTRGKTECRDVCCACRQTECGRAGIQREAGEIGPRNWDGKGTCSWLGFNDGCFYYSTHLEEENLNKHKEEKRSCTLALNLIINCLAIDIHNKFF